MSKRLLVMATILVLGVGVLLYLLIMNGYIDVQNKTSGQTIKENQWIVVEDEAEARKMVMETKWCQGKPKGKELMFEYVTYNFSEDGSYGWQKMTDYVPSPSGSGKWELAKYPSGGIYIILDKGTPNIKSGNIYKNKMIDVGNTLKYEDGKGIGFMMTDCE